MSSTELSSRRCGDVAEMHVAALLLRDPCLEVFQTLSDDGHGADLAVWTSRTSSWYAIQVKAATASTNPFVYTKRFRASADFLVAAVVLSEERLPVEVYLVPGTAWEKDDSGCLGRNESGGESGPYVEVRTTAQKHKESLRRYLLSVQVPTL